MNLCARYIRHLIVRARIFVNYFIITHTNSSNDNLMHIFKANFQSTCHGKNNNKDVYTVPTDLVEARNSFKNRFSNMIYTKTLVNGYARSLSTACQEIATCYKNTIVETFVQRVHTFFIQYLFKHSSYILTAFFIIAITQPQNNKVFQEFVKCYSYPLVCGGDSLWPENAVNTITDLEKQRIDVICKKKLSDIDIQRPMNKVSLPRSPGSCLFFLKKF